MVSLARISVLIRDVDAAKSVKKMLAYEFSLLQDQWWVTFWMVDCTLHQNHIWAGSLTMARYFNRHNMYRCIFDIQAWVIHKYRG